MGADQALQWIRVAEAVAALSGAGVLALNVIGFVTGWIVPWPTHKAVIKQLDFLQDLHFKKTQLLQELDDA